MSDICDDCGREYENKRNHDAIHHPNKGISDEASGYTKATDRHMRGLGLI
jgi:hypothetical protein